MKNNRGQCPQHQEFVSAVTELVGTVATLSTNISWMEKMGKWVMGLCISVVCLVIVGIFYAGAMWQQVQQNTQSIDKHHNYSQGATYATQEQDGYVRLALSNQLLF